MWHLQHWTDPCGFPNSTLSYSRCCPLLYPSPPTGSISSCLQLTLTEVTHLMDPWSRSLVTLGHAAQNSNRCDVISNRIRALAIPPLLKTCSLMSLSPNPPFLCVSPVRGGFGCRCNIERGCIVFLVGLFGNPSCKLTFWYFLSPLNIYTWLP